MDFGRPQQRERGERPMPTDAELELSFYERFFFAQGLDAYPVQEEAFAHIFAGRSVLVTVPTGTGKTMIGKAAIFRALERGQTAVYTSPLRALTEEKYRELAADFGEERVGFATGDYKVNPSAPLQVVVAEILWNRIYGTRGERPPDVVVMDETHYFNDGERGYVWEQSIIGLDPRTQLVLLSATIGAPEQFCAWAYGVRKQTLELVRSDVRRVPLRHDYREQYLLEVVKELHASGDTPAIIFTFGRERCFERARLLKSCSRFTSEEERAQIVALAEPVLFQRGLGKELTSLLLHGIGVHHAGVLPRYKQLVERLALDKLVKFVVSTETIAAGINLPARTVIFPELKKHIQGKTRLLSSAELHQMAGRAGRPQFDTEGLAIVLAPEEVVQEARKETREAKKSGGKSDEARAFVAAYSRARQAAHKNGDVTWDRDVHAKVVAGAPAPLISRARITAEQVLAIGLPDLSVPAPPENLPAFLQLDIRSVIANLLLPDRERQEARQRLEQTITNLTAMGVVDEHGRHIKGQLIGKLRGIDGAFVYHALLARAHSVDEARALVEYLVDHDVIHKAVTRADDEKRRDWIKNRLRERRKDEPQVSWEDVEAEYERTFPRELTEPEKLHGEFVAGLPHPELHGGKRAKAILAEIERDDLGFFDYIERHGLAHEEGNLFTYLARVMKVARQIAEASELGEFAEVERSAQRLLSVIDEHVAAPERR